MFEDISEVADRKAVLKHMRESNPVALSTGVPSVVRPKCDAALVRPHPSTITGIKILSDIDDTLTASGGPPGGVDKFYPVHSVYPGILQLYYELDSASDHTPEGVARFARYHDCHGTPDRQAQDLAASGPPLSFSRSSTSSLAQSLEQNPEAATNNPAEAKFIQMLQRQGNLTFLSARPHLYKNLSEGETFKKMKHLIEHNVRLNRSTTPTHTRKLSCMQLTFSPRRTAIALICAATIALAHDAQLAVG